MQPRRFQTPARPLVAVLCMFTMLAAACSSGAVEVAADRESGPIEIVQLGSAETTEQSQTGSVETTVQSPPPSAGGHDYGTSIDDFTAGSAQTSGSGGDFISWDDLIPEGFTGREIMARYEEQLDTVEIGSDAATELYAEIQAAFDPEAVNDDLDGQEIRLAGFVAPLTYVDDLVTEFLLVPNFGACIHVPPPPPNQTILVTLQDSQGLTIDESWGAVWVEGTIVIESSESELAPASYTIRGATSGVYDSF